jgi:hypothetical protein
MNSSLEAKAAILTNPESGLANDYLNHFNEILLMIENLPVLLPEMVDDILKWLPVSYVDYWEKSPLPGSAETLRTYQGLDPNFRADFESMIELLDGIVMYSINLIAAHRLPDGSIEPDTIEEICEKYSADLRAVLDRTADLVNHGAAPPLERPQHMADRLLGNHTQHKNVG